MTPKYFPIVAQPFWDFAEIALNFRFLKKWSMPQWGMKHETKIALSDKKNKRHEGAFAGVD